MSARRFVPLIVLMPVFEDRESACRLLSDLAAAVPGNPYVIAVEDGSLLDALRASDIDDAGLAGEVISLARNMGHQRAIAAGIAHLVQAYDFKSLVVMDSDGEDAPGAIPRLLEILDGRAAHVVVAERRQRSENWRFRAFYKVYRHLFKLLTGRKIRFGNFMALSPLAARRLAAMQETWVHFPASVIVSRLSIASVPIDRGRRYVGTSRMNLVSLALHGMRSIMVFADDVLVRVCLLCAVLIVLSIGLITTAAVLKLVGHATPGWFTSVAGLLISIVLQAGVLSFVTLMVSGVVKGSVPMGRVDLGSIIDRIERTDEAHAKFAAAE